MTRVCKYCGCDKFTAGVVEYHDCIVDGGNNWVEDLGCIDAERPHGLYNCYNCGAGADDLEDLTIEVEG